MSDGSPTKLFRDGDEESDDAPPDEEPTVTPTKIAEGQASDGSDMIRSDHPASGSLHHRMQVAGQFGASWARPSRCPILTTIRGHLPTARPL